MIDLQQGGLIQDFAIHTLAPLRLSKICLARFQDVGCVCITHCQQYLEMVAARFNLLLKQGEETYAEMRFTTTTGAPVIALLGKYVLGKDLRNSLWLVNSVRYIAI